MDSKGKLIVTDPVTVVVTLFVREVTTSMVDVRMLVV
jgi:hypothetical protein